PGNVNHCPAEFLADGIVGSHYDVIQACVELTQCLANPTRGQPNHRKGPLWDPVGFCHSAMGRKAMILRGSPPQQKFLYSSIRDHEETLTRHGENWSRRLWSLGKLRVIPETHRHIGEPHKRR